MNIKSNLKITTALALALYVNHANAMELVVDPQDDLQERHTVGLSQGLELDFPENHLVTSPQSLDLAYPEFSELALPPKPSSPFLGVAEDLRIYNDAYTMLQRLLSPAFQEALNNILTNVAYNESKRLCIEHGEKFVTPLVNSLIDANYQIMKHFTLKATGLKDLIKATTILTGEDPIPQKGTIARIDKSFSEKFRYYLSSQQFNDWINNNIIAPHLVGPSVAYAVHKMDLAGHIQHHLFSKIQQYLEEMKPDLVLRAEKRIERLKEKQVPYAKDIEDLIEKIKVWEDSEEVVKLKEVLAKNKLLLDAKAEECNAQQQVVAQEVSQMSAGSWLWNFLPGTSTENQIKLKALQSELAQYEQGRTNLINKIKAIKSDLDSQLWQAKYSEQKTTEEINTLTKILESVGKHSTQPQSKTFKFAKALANGFTQAKKEEFDQLTSDLESSRKNLKDLDDLKNANADCGEAISAKLEKIREEICATIDKLEKKLERLNQLDDTSIFNTAFAGKTLQEMMEPCPHLDYTYLKLLNSQNNVIVLGNEEQHSVFKKVLYDLKPKVEPYLEYTGVTEGISKIKPLISQERLTGEMNKILDVYTIGKAESDEISRNRAKIWESKETSQASKVFHVITSCMKQGGHIALTGLVTTNIVTTYTGELRDNVVSLGNSVRSAARPITIAIKGLKFYPTVWAVSYAGSWVFNVSMPYCPVIALGLGVMEDYDLWTPLNKTVTNAKKALCSSCFGDEKEKFD